MHPSIGTRTLSRDEQLGIDNLIRTTFDTFGGNPELYTMSDGRTLAAHIETTAKSRRTDIATPTATDHASTTPELFTVVEGVLVACGDNNLINLMIEHGRVQIGATLDAPGGYRFMLEKINPNLSPPERARVRTNALIWMMRYSHTRRQFKLGSSDYDLFRLRNGNSWHSRREGAEVSDNLEAYTDTVIDVPELDRAADTTFRGWAVMKSSSLLGHYLTLGYVSRIKGCEPAFIPLNGEEPTLLCDLKRPKLALIGDMSRTLHMVKRDILPLLEPEDD